MCVVVVVYPRKTISLKAIRFQPELSVLNAFIVRHIGISIFTQTLAARTFIRRKFTVVFVCCISQYYLTLFV